MHATNNQANTKPQTTNKRRAVTAQVDIKSSPNKRRSPFSVFFAGSAEKRSCLFVYCCVCALWRPAGVPTPAQDPINPLSCRSLSQLLRQHPPLLGLLPASTPHLPAMISPHASNLCSEQWSPLTHPYLLASNGSWIGALAPLAPTPRTLHAIALAVLTPTRPSNYLHASPGDVRRYAHIRMLAAPILPLLLTDLGCRRPHPSLPHHTHYTP
jgi:hypothetical protein